MTEQTNNDSVEVFRDASDQWRWHRVAPNGGVVSTSGEGFTNNSWALKSAHNYNRDVALDNFKEING